ncbi:hypothetical protein F0562_011676 [Nyssa sinensis]|uniref:Uncharacterized protein n=1 Tax=Nyssa sinensis TaxID=561372 RepID=A0A5J4ZT99_9ASTE|nr:hypothetical protein F0562_011676 [Nyssa sinensis]
MRRGTIIEQFGKTSCLFLFCALCSTACASVFVMCRNEEFHETLGGFKDYDMLLGPTGRSNLSISVYGIEIIIIYWESCMFIIEPSITVQLAIVDFRGIVDPEVALDLLITISRDPEGAASRLNVNLNNLLIFLDVLLQHLYGFDCSGSCLVSPSPARSALMSIREDGRSKLPLLVLTGREKTFMHQFW